MYTSSAWIDPSLPVTTSPTVAAGGTAYQSSLFLLVFMDYACYVSVPHPSEDYRGLTVSKLRDELTATDGSRPEITWSSLTFSDSKALDEAFVLSHMCYFALPEHYSIPGSTPYNMVGRIEVSGKIPQRIRDFLGHKQLEHMTSPPPVIQDDPKVLFYYDHFSKVRDDSYMLGLNGETRNSLRVVKSRLASLNSSTLTEFLKTMEYSQVRAKYFADQRSAIMSYLSSDTVFIKLMQEALAAIYKERQLPAIDIILSLEDIKSARLGFQALSAPAQEYDG